MTHIDERFELGPLVGSGGSAEVFRTRDLKTQREVALKRWKAPSDDAIARARFEREARILADLDHPHVVRYVAHGLDAAGRSCLVTEWLQGETVDDLISRERLSDWHALRILQEAASGLAALHTVGAVHRDVKPANLFLATVDDGVVLKVIDLGIAVGHDDLALTAHDIVVGSPVYVSPEQLRGEEPSPATDVYALAVVFHELLTGQRPYPAIETMALLRTVLSEPPSKLRAVRPDLPHALEALLLRCLDKSPARRPRRVTDFADEATAILQGVTTFPEGVPAATVLGRSEQRVRVLVVGRVSSDASPFALPRLEAALEAAGARVEREGERGLRGVFGDQRMRGDEAPRAARAALQAAGRGLRVVVVSGPTTRTADGLDGECVRRAAALLGATDEGQVRIDEPSAVLLAQSFELTADARGARLHREIKSPPWVPARPDDTHTHHPPGRDREVSLLAGILHDAWMQRAPHLVVLWGDAGIGKSRVAQAVMARLSSMASDDPRRAPGFLTLRGDALLASTPYGAVRRAVRAQCGIQEGDAPDRQRERVAQALSVLAGPLEIDAVLELAQVPLRGLDQPPPRPNAGPRPSERPRDGTRATVLSLLQAACARGPQLMVLEDLHFIDETTCELVAHLVDALWDAPFAVLCLGRTEPALIQRADRIWANLPRTDLRLGPLPSSVAHHIAEEALAEPRDAWLRNSLVKRADGNPLFLEELLRAAQAGTLGQRSESGEVALPVAAQAAVQLRLDALDHDARRVARAASVYGVTFWRRGLDALLGATSGAVIDRALRDLETNGFIAPRPASRLVATSEYAFRHALARDAAYATLLEDDRRELHARAAEWLEASTSVSTAALGHHRDRAGQRVQALHLWAQAARDALEEQAFEAAREYATRALGRDPDAALRRELLCVRADASWAIADAGTALADARAAESLPGASASERLRVALAIAHGLSLSGRLETALIALQSARAVHHPARGGRVSLWLWMQVTEFAAALLLGRGEAAEALALCDETLHDTRLGPEVGDYAGATFGATRAGCLLALDRLEDALALARGAAVEARQGEQVLRALDAGLVEALALVRLGDTAAAGRRYEAVRAEAQRLALSRHEALGALGAAATLGWGGEADESARLFRGAIALAERLAMPAVALQARYYASWVSLTQERRSDFESQLGWFALHAHERGVDGAQVLLAQAAQAGLLLRAREGEGALARIEPVAQRVAAGFAPVEGTALVGLIYAEVLHREGRNDEARTAVGRRRAAIHLAADRIDDPAQRARFLRDVHEHRALDALGRSLEVDAPGITKG